MSSKNANFTDVERIADVVSQVIWRKYPMLDKLTVLNTCLIAGWKALKSFKPDKNVLFSTWAEKKMKYAVFDEARIVSGSRNLKSHKQLKHVAVPSIEEFFSNKQLAEQIISNLEPRDKLIFKLYFYEGFLVKEIAVKLGVSPTRATQLLKRAICKSKWGKI